MAQPVFYQTLSMIGIDPTLYYANLATAGGSITPEYPAPPFLPGTQAFGSDGSQFVFVQASTSISLTDFIVVAAGATTSPFLANSVTTANAGTASTSVDMTIASTGLILKQSVSFIPANAMFWACTRGDFVPASSSANTAGMAAGSQVVLYTTTTPGQLTTTGVIGSTSAQGNVAFAGFNIISSISTSIAASVVPAVGTLSNGFTVGPVVSMNQPRTAVIITVGASGGTILFGSAGVYW